MLTAIREIALGLDGVRRTAWVAAAVFVALAILVPPNGVLNDNEEHYFALARHSVSQDEPAPRSSLLSSMPHAFVFSEVTGRLVGALGYERTQVVTRLLVVGLYTVALTALFTALGVGVLAAAAALLGFELAGQQLIGGEFLFFGAEPKTFAYPLVLLAIAMFLRARIVAGFLLIAAATWTHFLVGGIWAVLAAAALLVSGTAWREVAKGAGIYALCVLPLAAYLVISDYGRIGAEEARATLSASQIIAHVRSPHHTTPFLSLSDLAAWLPGIGLTAASAVLSAYAFRASQGRERLLASVVLVASCYLLLALVVTAIDRAGVLGPASVFRPSSLTLLLALVLAFVALERIAGSGAPVLRVGAAALIVAAGVPSAAADSIEPVLESRERASAQARLIEFARSALGPDSTVLIEPSLERELLSFERATGRPLLVMNKFVPSTGRGILEWYRRRQFQDELFARGCHAAAYPVTHLIARPALAATLSSSCGEAVFSDERYAVVSVARRTEVASD